MINMSNFTLVGYYEEMLVMNGRLHLLRVKELVESQVLSVQHSHLRPEMFTCLGIRIAALREQI